MIKLYPFLTFLITLIILPQLVFGASKVFEVQTSIIGNPPDVIPPSTPTITSATPVAVDQIDIEWSASTDNVFVNRYELFRDGVHVATTTLTSYSDSGLNSSTTYSYTVRAIDTSNNYSSTSDAVATSTFAVYVPPEIPPTYGTLTSVKLEDLNIEPAQNAVKFNWQANTYARYVFRWGRTSSYELGFVSTDIYKKNHKTVIRDLEPATTYEYEIIAYNHRGTEFILSRDQFTTLEIEDIDPPTNVSNLRAEVNNGNVTLYWDNPADEDFSHVRILRSHKFFPTDPYAGFLVYQGGGVTAYDQEAFLLGENQYYTVFSYDEKGNISSGAVLWVNAERGATDLRSIAFELDENDAIMLDDGSGDGVLVSEDRDPLTINDIEIIQNGRILSPDLEDRFQIDGSENFTIRIPYGILPEHLKTITVTLSHPYRNNQVFSFLLRVNKDKTAYEATVAPLEIKGLFGLTVDVFDFKTETLGRVTGIVSSDYSTIDSALPVVETMSKNPRVIIIITIGLLIFVLIIRWLVKVGQKGN